MELNAIVYRNRKFVGSLTDGAGILGRSYPICAQADPSLDAFDPAPGRYRFVRIAFIPAEDQEATIAYGPAVVFFEAVEGDAITEAGMGRMGGMGLMGDRRVLVLYGGQLDGRGRLLPTDGGIRLRNDDFWELVQRVRLESEVILNVAEARMGFIRWFTAPRVSRQRRYFVTSSGYNRGDLDDDFEDTLFWMWLLRDRGSYCDEYYPPALPPDLGQGGDDDPGALPYSADANLTEPPPPPGDGSGLPLIDNPFADTNSTPASANAEINRRDPVELEAPDPPSANVESGDPGTSY